MGNQTLRELDSDEGQGKVDDLVQQLMARITLDLPSHLQKITQYGFRTKEDFDKYEAMSERLPDCAKVSNHEKAATYDAIANTLRDKLHAPKMQFEAYFVALFADKEFAKVIVAVVFDRTKGLQQIKKLWIRIFCMAVENKDNRPRWKT
ncbi:hypothetical protein QZH41_004683 [Actinostola sp. cb2023]|nr:hypothetical protein QZH41_004683 [Actinostola sp. cb2023]